MYLMKKIKEKKKGKKSGGCIILGIVMIVWAFLPPSPGKLPLFYDDSGNVISDSITEKIYDVGVTQIGMLLTGKNRSNPVLLFLGGGPGIPEYLLEYLYPSKLADEFVVCYLEYREHQFLIIPN